MNVWVTSDHHFGHVNVIKYCDRPFRTVEDMDQTMIDRWNEVVRPGDTVYHLGDFAFGKGEALAEYRRRLCGDVILIRGNHDRRSRAKLLEAGFQDVVSSYALAWARPELRGAALERARLPPTAAILLQHRPLENAAFRASGYSHHFCGHVHDLWATQYGGRIVNVGVDQWDFRPVSVEVALLRSVLG